MRRKKIIEYIERYIKHHVTNGHLFHRRKKIHSVRKVPTKMSLDEALHQLMDHLHLEIDETGYYLVKKGKTKSTDELTKESTIGKITAHKCETCGHHEIGITDQAGRYMALKPGTNILLL